MNKYLKRLIGVCLCVCCLTSNVMPVYAKDKKAPAKEELHITSIDEFMDFTENCRIDSYSQDLVVQLDVNLNLTGMGFTGIPIFCGEFNGNDHTIAGITFTHNGSEQGLFRYLTKTAYVHNLDVHGELALQGSRGTIGGIAGSNAGRIVACSFDGLIAGGDRIGGLVGINQVSGIVEQCTASGSVHGNHFVGGLVGENLGLIRDCTNTAEVNNTADQNNIALSDVTMDTLTGTESAKTVTDIGGIAGCTSGVIRGCDNRGTVGYQHMGYNIGGIAGSQKGYIAQSNNYGEVFGRKEVGGIVGQMEPVSKVEFTRDTLQMLQKQLASTSSLANQVSANAQNSANRINGQMETLHSQAGTALNAIQQLVPDPNNPTMPDSDTILAAKNALSGSLSSMQGTMSSITSSTQSAVDTMSDDIKAIANQMSAISNTLNNASKNLGFSVTDVSDGDKDDDLTGKVDTCQNFGDVNADLNAGGIIGAIAWENDLDPEDDFQFSGDQSLNFASEMRAVVLNCENKATVTAKKRQVGGIVGWMNLGLAKNCVNTGHIEAETGEYVGGIAGNSNGYIRNCSAKCALSGAKYAGGIAGSAVVATDCRSMVVITDGNEKIGAILGSLKTTEKEMKNPFSDNYYLVTNADFGGVDGISYSNLAQPLTLEEFTNIEDLPEVFQKTTVTFLYNNGNSEAISVPLGEVLSEEEIPAVPKKVGYTGAWDGLEDIDLENIFFDMIFQPIYTPYRTTIASEETRDNGKAVLLAQGEFSDLETIEIKALDEAPILSEWYTAVEGWTIPVFSKDGPTQLRLSCPDAHSPDECKLFVRDSDGNWYNAPITVNGNYLVFSVNPTDDAIFLFTAPNFIHWGLYALGGICVIILLSVGTVYVKRKKKVKLTKS